eukprot:jgi/Ulvmu1/3524/UM163_0005.1
MEASAAFSVRAKARGLCLPKADEVPDRTVVWDGRTMHLVGEGQTVIRSKFTYKSGEKMAGFVEQPCTESSKLIAGEYRAINQPNITKEGQDWKPGNRYTCTNQKLDCHVPGEAILANGKFSAHLLDAGNVPFKKGKIMWSEGRFSHVPGRTSAANYETMCKKLNDTSRWQQSRPESKFEPGYAEYTTRPMDWDRQQALAASLPDAPAGFSAIREADGNVTMVPDTSSIAKQFGSSKLVPACRGAIPNGPAAFSVHQTSTGELRWLTRCLAQRTAGNVPITGPGGIPYLHQQQAVGRTVKRS